MPKIQLPPANTKASTGRWPPVRRLQPPSFSDLMKAASVVGQMQLQSQAASSALLMKAKTLMKATSDPYLEVVADDHIATSDPYMFVETSPQVDDR